MKKQNIKIFSAILFCLIGISNLSAQNYVAITREGNVYDEASAKYITLNQNNDEVAVIPGMVFPTSEHTPGWYMVEYSPGLHAFIPDQIVASNFQEIKPGSYTIKNNANKQLKAEGSGDNWTATVDGTTFKGVKWEDILVFVDANNNIAYSLVDLGEGPIAITYDNKVTKFF